MPSGVWSVGQRAALAFAGFLAFSAGAARATPYLVADAESGQVLIENEATAAWYPASLTKLMTVYVALDAVRAGKLTMDTPLVMSARAARMQPSKMGFRPGTEVTLDNALKMLMVKSPNDVAVMVAEGVSGSVEAFADDMNAAGEKLGLHESHFVNPNGLHDPESRVLGARHGDDRPRSSARFPRPRRPVQHWRARSQRPDHPQSQRPSRTLPRRRRHEDRLHLSGRVERRGDRQPLRPAPDHGRARGGRRRSCATRRRPTCSTEASPWAAAPARSIRCLPRAGARRAPTCACTAMPR